MAAPVTTVTFQGIEVVDVDVRVAEYAAGQDYGGSAAVVIAAKEPHAMSRTQGSVILVPAHILHRVAAVTSGLRRSLFRWIGGPNFR